MSPTTPKKSAAKKRTPPTPTPATAGAPQVLLDLLERARTLRLRDRPGGGLARGGEGLREGQHRRGRHAAGAGRSEARREDPGAATAGDGPHRRDRADRDAHRRSGLPVVRLRRRLGRADPRRPARGPRHTRGEGHRRRGQEADSPAARRRAQEGGGDSRPAHRHRRARRRATPASGCGSATWR